MPGASDDDIFKRMFASFVARKTRSTPIPPPSPAYPLAALARHPPSTRRFPPPSHPSNLPTPPLPPPPTLPPPPPPPPSRLPYKHPRHAHHQFHHQHHQHHQHQRLPQPTPAPSRAPPLTSLFHLRSPLDHRSRQQAAANPAPVPAASANPLTRPRQSRSSKGSRGSKGGSKGSEKPPSVSTEDAPPRKRTRVHPASLHRSHSAHASLLSSHSKPETNSARVAPPSTTHVVAPSQPNKASAHASASTPSPTPNNGTVNQLSAKKSSNAAKSFPCDKCPATFAQKGQLSRHTRRVHDKLRPHACEHCGRLFGAKSDRTRHVMIVHKKMRQFPCERCGFQFQAKTHLEAHIRTVHDGVRPYRCDQCGFSFGLRSNLLTHERAVHFREAKWNCTVCDTAFNRKHDMFRHMKLMHDIDSSGTSGSHAKKGKQS